jgi:hypothetical protein
LTRKRGRGVEPRQTGPRGDLLHAARGEEPGAVEAGVGGGEVHGHSAARIEPKRVRPVRHVALELEKHGRDQFEIFARHFGISGVSVNLRMISIAYSVPE